MTADMEHFFMELGSRSPLLVSDLVATLAAGVPLKAERVPRPLLPHVLLLATIGLQSYRQAIVDDYPSLLQRVADEWEHPEFTHRVFWHPELSIVSCLTFFGAAQVDLSTLPEAGYMFGVYERLVNRELSELFGAEKKDAKSQVSTAVSRNQPRSSPVSSGKNGAKTAGRS